MSNLDTLPKEILYEIISCLGRNVSNLAKCALVSRNVSEVANARLYSHIDLQRDERYDEEADARTDIRQVRLIKSIAENPKLGSLVRTFKNYKYLPFDDLGDGTTAPVPDIGVWVRAARNMAWLSKAFFTRNNVAAHVIANLPSYRQLVDLSVYGLKPEDHIWAVSPTSLRKLSWTVPVNRWIPSRVSPWRSIDIIIAAVEGTCPALETLDILFSNQIRVPEDPIVPTVGAEQAQLHIQNKQTATRGPVLANLKHLGVQYAGNQESDLHHIELEELVQRYSSSLVSIDIPFGVGPWTRERLEHILRLCNMLPGLKSLLLTNSNLSNERAANISAPEFLQELCYALASPKFEIKRLSITKINCTFSQDVGNSLQQLKSLKYLKVGDAEMDEGPFGNDGRAQFDQYQPEILAFIQVLPRSLEELFLEINGRDVSCQEDEEFDVMCDMGPHIFRTLHRLRSCDIHAWISNIDDGLDWIPEKCVFHRRLPHLHDTGIMDTQLDQWQRDLWTSRMDNNVDKEYGAEVSIKKEILELDAGSGSPFEGNDAEEAWLGGFTHKPNYGKENGTREEQRPDYSWPSWENKVMRYEGFTDRHS